MKRQLTVGLILGCFLILCLELPGVVEEVGRGLAGPYSDWPDTVVDAEPAGPSLETPGPLGAPRLEPYDLEVPGSTLLAAGVRR